MATLSKTFHRESERVHQDHYHLTEELRSMGMALEHLTADLNDPTNLAAAKGIQMFAKQMADELPGHFRHEEREVLTIVSEVSPELDFLAREIRRQHEALDGQLIAFCRSIDELGTTGDVAATVEKIRKAGRTFIRDLNEHIALEEQELRGFL